MFIARKFILLLAIFLTACASTPENKDPMEGYNRAIYSFNEVVDDYVAKPVAKGYLFVMPDVAVKGVNNFFNNIRDFITVVNDILQMKFNHAANDAGRVITNTTVGLLGFIDVHSMNGGERRKEDFGQTLAHYGWENSAYFVLPVLGPSTVRDTGGLLVDSMFFDPISYINDVRFRNALRIVQFIDARAELLNTTAILDQAALDPYAFQRDAYLQYREKLINDNNVSEDEYDKYNFIDGKNSDDLIHYPDTANYDFYLNEDINQVEIDAPEKISAVTN
jgi:phospholipid-binding lipoprotein MlaA